MTALDREQARRSLRRMLSGRREYRVAPFPHPWTPPPVLECTVNEAQCIARMGLAVGWALTGGPACQIVDPKTRVVSGYSTSRRKVRTGDGC